MYKSASKNDKLKSFIGEKNNETQLKNYILGRPFALDMGTTNTRIYRHGDGIVLNEPTVVAFEKVTKKILATGSEAKRYIGKTPVNIEVIRPYQGSTVCDFDLIHAMLMEFFLKIQKKKKIFKSKLISIVPTNISAAEKKVLRKAAKDSGLGKILFLEEPLAAAMGAGLSIFNKKGQMILDIGGGSAKVSIISVGAVVYNNVENLGGDSINEAIKAYLLEKHQLQVGENRAEQCKIEAAAIDGSSKGPYIISGKDAHTNIPKEVSVDAEAISKAISQPVEGLTNMIIKTMVQCPSQFVSDIMEDGLYLTGGGTLLKGLKEYIGQKTGLACHVSKDPMNTVINGVQEVLANCRKYKKILSKN